METQWRSRINSTAWIRILKDCRHAGEETNYAAGEVIQEDAYIARDLIRAGWAEPYRGDDDE